MRSQIERKDRFFQVLCSLPEKEIEANVSVTFRSVVDLTEIEKIRQAARRSGNTRPSYNAFVIRALAVALKEFPYANRRVFRQPWRPMRGPQLQSFMHADVAVAVERLQPGREFLAFVDVIRDADAMSLDELTAWLRTLAQADESNNEQWREFNNLIRRFPWWLSSLIARSPVYLPRLWEKYRGSAALVTSPAKYGVDGVAASWAWPLGVSFGLVAERPMVVNHQLTIRPTFEFVINFDRRVMAGAQAAQFFARCAELLSNPGSEHDAQQEQEAS